MWCWVAASVQTAVHHMWGVKIVSSNSSINPNTAPGNNPNQTPGKDSRDLPLKYKVLTWLATTLVAVAGLVISIKGYSAQDKTATLATEQTQQISELQKTTPTGNITGMIPYRPSKRQPPIAVRKNPVLQQEVYNLSGTALNVPDNGSLFMVVHDYGQPQSYFGNSFNYYYIVGVTLYYSGSAEENWKADGVYIGAVSAPSVPLSYRLTLYFCGSVDAEKMVAASQSSTVQNYGLRSLPYPSCKQLDSIFVTRAANDRISN